MKKQDKKPPHLFPGDSPASPFPAPGNNGDLRTNGIYGPKCSALSGNCTPLGCLEKMLLASSIWGSTRRFLTWSRQATPLGFSYFLLSPSAHGMSAKELSSSAMLLPTPLASDTGDVGKTVDVRMTPTGSFRKYNPSGTVWTARLSWAVYKLLGSPPGDVKLNPDWVEWLMGFPPEMDGHSMWAKESAQIPYLISDPPANVAKRLKTLGNAVVPPQVYPILRYIAEIETGRCRNRQQGGDRIWNP